MPQEMILERGMYPTALPLPGCFGPTDMAPGWATELTSRYPTPVPHRLDKLHLAVASGDA